MSQQRQASHIDLSVKLEIERLGERGEGIARGPHGNVFVPYALAGEKIIAEVDGERGHLAEILKPSEDRVPPICRYYTICGGCAVQALAQQPYQTWKHGLLIEAMRHAGLPLDSVGPLIDAHGEGRRRATFHARPAARGGGMQGGGMQGGGMQGGGMQSSGMQVSGMRVGFMQARAHELVEIEACPVLATSMDAAIPAAQALADMLSSTGKPLDIVATATASGLDLDIRGCGVIDNETTQKLIEAAQRLDLARVSNHGTIVIERRPPQLAMGEAYVMPPPGAFLQATLAGEELLVAGVVEALREARTIGDLFAGVGTFALRLAKIAEVHAFDFDEAALSALDKAARATQSIRSVAITRRDLFRRPLNPQELNIFDALVFDPPRSGAEAQARAIASSDIPVVAYVSCSARSFARDASLLCAGGYHLEKVEVIDQFKFSPHIEIIGIFRREVKKKPRRKRLLG